MITSLLESGIDFTLWLQSLGDILVPSMEFFTFLGTENFYLFVLPIFVWALDYRLGLRIGAVLLLSTSLNAFLKWAFHLPRPYWFDARVAESSFGLPSGHAQNSVAIYGLIAALVKRKWAWIAAGTLAFLIGFSRIILGVHFYIDVLFGWATGAVLLFAFLKFENSVRRWLDQRPFGQKVTAAFAVSVLILLVGIFFLSVGNNFPFPDNWNANALADQPGEGVDPLNIESVFTSAGSLFGLAVGAFWLGERGWFDAAGKYWERGIRVLIGIIGTLIIWQGLGIVFPSDPDLLSYFLRFLRYALTTYWISGLAPWIFVKLKIAKSKSLVTTVDS